MKDFFQAREKWQKSPITRHYTFSDKKLWSKQEEILWAVRNHKRVCVKSGNTVGKSFISADVVMDFLSIHYPSKVITTAPTWTQVEDIIWKEIAGYCHNSKFPLGIEPLNTELNFKDDWFAKGISTNEVHRMQGFHSPHLLVVIDEASGVTAEIWEAVESLHPYRVLAIGNPNEISGDFYNVFSSPLWHKISISCLECVEWQEQNHEVPGLVTRDWIEERRQDWGEKSPQYAIHVLGEFPEEAEGTLISRDWVEAARNKESEDEEDDSMRCIACDVATKHGENETVIGYRYGHTLHWIKAFKHIPTTETADRLAWAYNEKKPHGLVIDSDGVGEGVADILSVKRVPHIEFHGGYGQKAIDVNRFRNLRSQFYWMVAKKFEKGFYSLKGLTEREYELLKNQLCSLKVKPCDAQGRIQIETKDDMMARGIKSPDYADCFVYLEYAWYMSRNAEVEGFSYR